MNATPAIYRMTAADRLRLIQAWRRMNPAQRALILARVLWYQIARV